MTYNIKTSAAQFILVSTCIIISQLTFAQDDASKDKPVVSDQQRQQNLESFDYVWKTVKDHYWDPTLGGVDWTAAKKELRSKVEMAETTQAARTAMRQLLDKLKVSHFGIIPAESYRKLDKDKPRGNHVTGIEVRVIDHQVIITDVLAGSPADKLGVRKGWEIMKIGETDLRKRLASIAEDLADHPHRRTILVEAAMVRLRGKTDEKIDFVFRDENDQQVELTIPVVEPRGKKSKFGHIPEFYLWIEVKKLPGNIGYIRFNAFMDPAYIMSRFNKAMVEFKETDGIIIDVRGNGGGLGEMGAAMMGWLLKDGKQQMGTVVMRDGKLKMLIYPRANPYEGKVAVLIDEMSISAAEFFASGMNDLNLAHLVGTRTAGAVLGSMIERLPNGDGFQYARANYISKTTGKTLEGIGVPPHQEVFHERAALLEGRDLQLEAAITWIEDQSKTH